MHKHHKEQYTDAEYTETGIKTETARRLHIASDINNLQNSSNTTTNISGKWE